MTGNHWDALALTCLGAAGTALGGALVCIQPKMDFQTLGVLQVGCRMLVVVVVYVCVCI